MGMPGIFELVLIIVVVLLLFGAGRVPAVMENFAKGIKSFKKGLKDEDDKPAIKKD
jgi:sec-independent protein translocase protein TatA